jgi:hypothetical protein
MNIENSGKGATSSELLGVYFLEAYILIFGLLKSK